MPDLDDDERVAQVVRTEWRRGAPRAAEDQVAREEPLEIRVAGVSIAVVMRTPGHDEELVRGFLISERIVAGAAEIASLRHATVVARPEAEDNVIDARLAGGARVDLESLRRNLYSGSSCGLCGKASIDAVLAHAPPLDGFAAVDSEVLYALPARLAAAQDVFHATGGLHAAGLFNLDGSLRVVREDVGRHNAVDKVIGWAAGRGGAAGQVLLVSGRVSFEVVQKALAARIAVVAAVSAPTSLAVELARASRVTLVGFLRGERMCVYSGTPA